MFSVFRREALPGTKTINILFDKKKFSGSSEAQDYFNTLCKIRTDTPGVVIASINKEEVLCFHTDRSWQGERLTTSTGLG